MNMAQEELSSKKYVASMTQPAAAATSQIEVPTSAVSANTGLARTTFTL
jgi:hypothetical protein